MPSQGRKKEIKKAARERIGILFAQAEQRFPDPLAHRYVELARKLAMKARIRIPRELRRRFCGKCHRFLMPGKNARVRTQDGHVVIRCIDCGHTMRIPYR